MHAVKMGALMPSERWQMLQCFQKHVNNIKPHERPDFHETYGTLRKNILNGRTKCGPVG
jgi:hypothetical protein